jgi:hypothetical protein
MFISDGLAVEVIRCMNVLLTTELPVATDFKIAVL